MTEMGTSGNLIPFALSKLFTHRLKGGIEKQGRDSVGWHLPPQSRGRSQPANLRHVNGSLALFHDYVEPILQINPHYNTLILKEKKLSLESLSKGLVSQFESIA